MKIHKTILVYEDGYKQTLESPNLENLCDMIDFYIERAKDTGHRIIDVVSTDYEI